MIDVRDAEKRSPEDPSYDPTTLFIPAEDYTKMTETRKQYWDFKRRNFDTLTFFQVGSFYELYENDAKIGVQVMDLKMTEKINMSSAGVPLKSVEEWTAKFVALGYRVARISQGKADVSGPIRENRPRKVDQILTIGTLVESSLLGPLKNLLISVREDQRSSRIGFSLVECSLGIFRSGEFEDDPSRSMLETLLIQCKPREAIYFNGSLSRRSLQLLRSYIPLQSLIHPLSDPSSYRNDALGSINYLDDQTRTLPLGFWSSKFTIEQIHNYYFRTSPVPQFFFQFKDQYSLMMSAIGGAISFLVDLKLDKVIVPKANFEMFDLNQKNHTTSSTTSSMILDGGAISNLELFENSFDSSSKGTLWEFVNHCHTPFGQRLLHQWICTPLYREKDINRRLDAVTELVSIDDNVIGVIEKTLKKLPDLERLLSRIHMQSVRNPQTLIDFIGGLESISLLLYHINQLQLDHSTELSSDSTSKTLPFHSELLLSIFSPRGELTKSSIIGRFPDISDALDLISKIDITKSHETKSIIQRRGFDPEYDQLTDQLAEKSQEVEQIVVSEKQKRKITDLKLVEKGKQYLIEVPIKLLGNKKLDQKFEDNIVDRLKSVIRYRLDSLDQISDESSDIKAAMNERLESAVDRLQKQLDQSFEPLRQLCHCIAEFDCLLSLRRTSYSSGYSMIRPEILDTFQVSPTLIVQQGIHPYLKNVGAANATGSMGSVSDVIPNDIFLGGGKKPNQTYSKWMTDSQQFDQLRSQFRVEESDIHPRCVLLTGPNMGGKSTYLRLACIMTILSQIGCFVPAESCHLTPVDRIFTRLGAQDNIFEGSSTFMVELRETANVLNNATSNSLVIFDELGRGTSTFDGMAIAHSVVHDLVYRIECRMMFATHYHLLIDDWKAISHKVSLYHMSCYSDDGNGDDDDDDGDGDGGQSHQLLSTSKRKIVFLYQAKKGACPRSYGMNVALLAGMETHIIERAELLATEFEKEFNQNRITHNGRERATVSSATLLSQELVSLLGQREPSSISFFDLAALWKSSTFALQ